MLYITGTSLRSCSDKVLCAMSIVFLCLLFQCRSAQGSVENPNNTKKDTTSQQLLSCTVSPRIAYKNIMNQTQSPVMNQKIPSKAKSHTTIYININTATEAELVALPRIGVKKAQAIVAYRKQHGSFNSIYELINIKGIGKKTVMNFADKITIY